MQYGDGAIELDEDGVVATITINRPEVSNALNLATARALVEAVAAVENDPSIRAAILTGAGERAFCAGLDIRARAAGEPRPRIAPYGFGGFVGRPRRKPFIAAVNGWATGGGFELVMSCDLVVAGPEAHFSLPETKRGLVAAGDCLPLVTHRFSASVAAELALTGRQMFAQEAMEKGLVNAVGDPRKLAHEYASQIAACAPLPTAETLTLLGVLATDKPRGYHELAEQIQRRLMESVDAAEGSRSFLEKRDPVWVGR